MLEIENLAIRRGDFQILLPKLTLNDGEVVALRGSSGCGKSTVLEMIGLILKPDSLKYYQLGNHKLQEDITDAIHQQQESQLAKIRAEFFGFMLQSGGLLPYLNIKDNIALPCQLLKQMPDKSWIDYLIEQLTVAHLLNHYPKQLSIGERQRISFIRSLAHRPSVVLADEPTAALDPYNAEKLVDIIIKLVRQHHISALIVSHDWKLLEQKNLRFLTGNVINNQATFEE